MESDSEDSSIEPNQFQFGEEDVAGASMGPSVSVTEHYEEEAPVFIIKSPRNTNTVRIKLPALDPSNPEDKAILSVNEKKRKKLL